MGARSISALFAALVLAVIVAACRGQSSGVTEMQGEERKDVWATIHRDVAGWVVHPVNVHGPDVHLDDVDMSKVPGDGSPDAHLVVHGSVHGGTFAVDEAYRVLPGGTWSPDHVFIQLENDVPTRLNLAASVEVPAIDVSRVETDWIDHRWLADRIHHRGAVLAGLFFGQAGEGIERFEATAVFVPLPDRLTSCPRRARDCPAGTVPAYQRDVDRCLVFTRCVVPTTCPAQPPPCAAGYVLRSWRAPPHACPDYACDASFLPE